MAQLLYSHVFVINASSQQSSSWSHAEVVSIVWVENTQWSQKCWHMDFNAVKSILCLTSHLTSVVMEIWAELVMHKWSWLIWVLASSQCFSSGVSASLRQTCQSKMKTGPLSTFGIANHYNITDCLCRVNQAVVLKWDRGEHLSSVWVLFRVDSDELCWHVEDSKYNFLHFLVVY